MSSFITKFNHELRQGVAATQLKLAALKKTTDEQTDHAKRALEKHLDRLDIKIQQQSVKLDAMDDEFEDWAFHKAENAANRKDGRTSKKLSERALQTQKRSERAFSKALHAIDKAEREMLRSKMAHADAGLAAPESKSFPELADFKKSVGAD